MLQPGKGYTFTTAEGVNALDIEAPWPFPAEPDQFQVSTFKTDTGHAVQCRKGFVRFASMKADDPWAFALWQAEVRKFYGYPTGSKTTGDAPTAADSSLVDLGGYIEIQPASVEGGSDSWGVYIIGCGDTMSGFWPYLAIMADGSDADIKSNYFNGSNAQIIVKLSQSSDLIEVTTPTGSVYLTNQNTGNFVAYNYNCQKWKIATLTFDGTSFVVTQSHLGPLCLPNPVDFTGLDTANLPPYTPYYESAWLDWLGSWSDYTKDSTDATVVV